MAQLACFDDEAFVALANRGLLRRAHKDLEKQAASIVEETPQQVVVGFGEHRVGFDARGPAHAQCTCQAGGVCQHILAAAIALQRMGNAAVAGHNPAGNAQETGAVGVGVGAAATAGAVAATDRADPVSDGALAGAVPDSAIAALHASLLAMPQAALVKHAGKPGYRWAWQFVHDLDLERGLRLGGERHIVIGFQHPRITLRYLGGGVESLVADVQTSHLAKHQVAAVLAYRRAHGIDDPPPEAPGKARSATLDLGKDHAPPGSAADTQQASRDRLRSAVLQLLVACVALGLSHLSRSIHERFATLAVWAQGAEYYRLALLLRRIADHVELLLERAGGADERRLFDEMALACGLVGALAAAAAQGAAPPHLVGRARSRYEEIGSLELLGLGAHAWRSGSGYVGMTMVFWSPTDQAFHTCTDARPELQRAFDPRARYKAPGPWNGLGAPEQATGRCVRLTHAQVNAQGRLSAAETTAATVLPSPDFAAQLAPCSRWAELREARALARRSLLAEAEPMRDWVVLAPESFGKARFDAARQLLTWPLLDRSGERLDVELPYSDTTEHAIRRIEGLAAAGVRVGSLVVARIRGTTEGLVAEPLSLVRVDARDAENPVDALHFDPAPQQGMASRWMAMFRRNDAATAGERKRPAAALPDDGALSGALRRFAQALQVQAERGIPEERLAPLRRELSAEVERLASFGYTAFSPSVDAADGSVVAGLLRARYVCMQYERLIDDLAGDADDDMAIAERDESTR